MEFGVFDHLDRDGQPLAAFYESRLRLIEAYDAGPATRNLGRGYPVFDRACSTESKKRR